MSEPKIQLYRQNLFELAASMIPPQSGEISINDKDLNGDGNLDVINIYYREDRYVFNVLFGTEQSSRSNLSRQGLSIEQNDFQFIFNRLMSGISETKFQGIASYYIQTTTGVQNSQLDWKKVIDDYPILGHFVTPNVPAEQRAYITLLFKSESFRRQLVHAQKRGVKIQTGPFLAFDKETKTLYVSQATNSIYFLQAFPHELRHIDDQKVTEDMGVEKFINDNIVNEMAANHYAFGVLKELGLKISPLWPSYQLYVANKNGEDKFRRAQKKEYRADGDYTYVEFYFFTYQAMQKQQTIYPTLSSTKPLREATANYFNYIREMSQTALPAEKIVDNIPDDVSSFPEIKGRILQNRNKLLQCIDLLRKRNGSSVDFNAKWEAFQMIGKIHNEIISPGLEYVRNENATRYGLEDLYQ